MAELCVNRRLRRPYGGAKPMNDDFEACGQPVLRGNYCHECIAGEIVRSSLQLYRLLGHAFDLAKHVAELIEPRDRHNFANSVEAVLSSIKEEIEKRL